MNARIGQRGLMALVFLWLAGPSALADQRNHSADPHELIVVIESGDNHVSIIDGERFERIHRFASRPALQGAPGFSPDGRYAYFASGDGWVSKFDLWKLEAVAETRAGIRTNGLAVSGDGKFVAVANAEPHTLVLLDADLGLLKSHAAVDRNGSQTSPVTAVHTARRRQSFVAALRDVKEIWELSYDPQAPEIAVGVVHDFQYREGAFVPGFLNPKRSFPDDPIADFLLAPDHNEIVALSPANGRGQVVHLDVRRSIGRRELTPITSGRPAGEYRVGDDIGD